MTKTRWNPQYFRVFRGEKAWELLLQQMYFGIEVVTLLSSLGRILIAPSIVCGTLVDFFNN